MYCQNCGNKLEDDAKFCEICGAKVEEVLTAATDQDTSPRVKVKVNPMVIGIAVAVVVVLLMNVIAFKSLSGGYKKPVKDIVSLINKQESDLSPYVKASQPGFIADAFSDALKLLDDVEYVTNDMDNFSDRIDDAFAELKDYYGSTVKVSYKILDKRELTKKEISQIRDNYRGIRSELKNLEEGGSFYKNYLADELSSSQLSSYNKIMTRLRDGLTDFEISKGYRLSLSIEVKGKMNEDEETIDVNVFKTSGKWCLDVSGDSMDDLLNLLR